MAKQQQTRQEGSQQQQSGAVMSRQPGGEMAQSPRPSFLGLSPFDLLAAGPFPVMRRMMEEIDRMFEVVSPSAAFMPALYVPPIEVTQRDGALVVRTELPGMTKDDVRVEWTPEGLLIQGEKKEEREERQEGMVRTERRYGRFSRLIPLPEEVKMDQAQAQFAHGVLEVTVPLSEEQQRRRQIQIQESGQAAGQGGPPQEQQAPGSGAPSKAA